MGKHRRIRGLPTNLAAAADQVAHDMESDHPEAQARMRTLQRALSRDGFTVLKLAAQGHGPRLLQKRFGGTTLRWRDRIWEVLSIASYHSDAAQRYRELMEE